MENKQYNRLLQWVDKYIKSYYGLDEEIDANIKLKEKHTYLVVARGKEVADHHISNEEEYVAAIVSCLLHDIGRFHQFKTYRTFRDKDSLDHGLLGLDIIFKNNLLMGFSPREQCMIEKAVYFHNKICVNDSLSYEEKLICDLVRDADKLDIFRVITDYYDNPEGNKYVFVGKGLSDSPEYTKEILDKFLNKKTIDYNHVVTQNDLKLLQLAWAFDLNFSSSFRIVKEKEYAKKILDHLPENSVKSEIEGLIFG